MDVFDTRYFRLNKRLLSFAGLWLVESSFNKNIIFYCVMFAVLIIALPQVTYLFKHVRSLYDFFDLLPTLVGASICLVKPISFRYMFDNFKMIVQHVRYDWCLLASHEDIRILIEYVERSRIFTLAYLIFVSMGATSYITAPLTVPIFDMIMASNVTRPKRLPHPSEFFVDLEKYYYILLAITYIGYAACILIVVGIDTIYIALLQHACGVLAILSHRLKNLGIHSKSKCIDRDTISGGEWDKDFETMIQCVQLQVRVERLIQLIESMFAMCLLVDIGCGIFFQCAACVMIVIHMDTMEMMRNGSLLFLQSFRIFFNSWIGQQIINHSSQVFVAAYNGMWYQTSLKIKKMLLFLIMKCQKPSRITMAKLYVLSLEGYATLMKTSASYVTLMISVSSDDI